MRYSEARDEAFHVTMCSLVEMPRPESEWQRIAVFCALYELDCMGRFLCQNLTGVGRLKPVGRVPARCLSL